MVIRIFEDYYDVKLWSVKRVTELDKFVMDAEKLGVFDKKITYGANKSGISYALLYDLPYKSEATSFSLVWLKRNYKSYSYSNIVCAVFNWRGNLTGFVLRPLDGGKYIYVPLARGMRYGSWVKHLLLLNEQMQKIDAEKNDE